MATSNRRAYILINNGIDELHHLLSGAGTTVTVVYKLSTRYTSDVCYSNHLVPQGDLDVIKVRTKPSVPTIWRYSRVFHLLDTRG
jgi:hypothetical protein